VAKQLQVACVLRLMRVKECAGDTRRLEGLQLLEVSCNTAQLVMCKLTLLLE
jgi:hypothetical protein